jgi:HTH-type transcriptional regulator / antitoxin HigA
MDPPDPIDAIQFRMEQQGLTRKNLEPLIGSRARVAEITEAGTLDRHDPTVA